MIKKSCLIISALAVGAIVAMAGDPFYDAPAIKSSAAYVAAVATTNVNGTTNTVAFQAYDVAGKTFAGSVSFTVWVSTNSSNPTNDDCDSATLLTGTLLKTITSTNAFNLLTLADGTASMRLVDTAGRTNGLYTVAGANPARGIALKW